MSRIGGYNFLLMPNVNIGAIHRLFNSAQRSQIS